MVCCLNYSVSMSTPALPFEQNTTTTVHCKNWCPLLRCWRDRVQKQQYLHIPIAYKRIWTCFCKCIYVSTNKHLRMCLRGSASSLKMASRTTSELKTALKLGFLQEMLHLAIHCHITVMTCVLQFLKE